MMQYFELKWYFTKCCIGAGFPCDARHYHDHGAGFHDAGFHHDVRCFRRGVRCFRGVRRCYGHRVRGFRDVHFHGFRGAHRRNCRDVRFRGVRYRDVPVCGLVPGRLTLPTVRRPELGKKERPGRKRRGYRISEARLWMGYWRVSVGPEISVRGGRQRYTTKNVYFQRRK